MKPQFSRTRLVLTCLLHTLGGQIVLASSATQPSPVAKPNIIVIVADDMGYGDVGCYGGNLVPTPNLDRLAQGGTRCTAGYVTAPLCAPSRCGLLTGAYNQRFGMQNNADNRYRIPETQRVLPEVLSTVGYVTGHFGKWNIPRDAKGVCDEVHDLMDFAGAYFPDKKGVFPGVDGAKMDNALLWTWGAAKDGTEYLTDRITRHALEFIDRHANRNFFMYIGYNAPHTPLQADAEFKNTFSHIKEEPLRLYYAMIASLDRDVGKLIDHLQAKGLWNNTLFVFTSDNGPSRGSPEIVNWPSDWSAVPLLGSTGPFNGHKGTMFEGGIRVPYIVSWPARLKAGQVFSKPISTLDILPTFCAAAGAKIPDRNICDGVSLLPFLVGENAAAPHDKLFWKMGNMAAARLGDWKILISQGTAKPGDMQTQRVQLYELRSDPGEKHDVATTHPEIVARLKDEWNAWSAPMPLPANVALRGVRKE